MAFRQPRPKNKAIEFKIENKPHIMRKSDEAWLTYKDGHFKTKRFKLPQKYERDEDINDFVVELFYGTERGGQINIWSEGKSTLPHVWSPSDDNKYHLADQVNFMDWRNAKEEFSQLTNWGKVVDLMERNS